MPSTLYDTLPVSQLHLSEIDNTIIVEALMESAFFSQFSKSSP